VQLSGSGPEIAPACSQSLYGLYKQPKKEKKKERKKSVSYTSAASNTPNVNIYRHLQQSNRTEQTSVL